jgi:hypothetical protein
MAPRPRSQARLDAIRARQRAESRARVRASRGITLPPHLRTHVDALAHRWRLTARAALVALVQAHMDDESRRRGHVVPGCACEHCAMCPLVDPPEPAI